MFKYLFEANVKNDDSYELVLYDRHHRKHFSTEISRKDYQLYWDDRIAFVDWIEETFADVIERLV
jgi:hypothetical protein